MEIRKKLEDFFIITLGAVITAGATFFFLIPSKTALGSISGLSIVLANLIPFSVSEIVLLFDVLLLVIGFLFIGKNFGLKTVYTSILIPVVMKLLEQGFPDFESLMGNGCLDMISYIFFANLGISMLVHRNASSGGLDIVAKLMNKYLHMEFGKASALSGMAIAFSSMLVYDGRTVVLSIIGTYLNGIVLDYYLFGLDNKKRVCIISRQEEKIRSFILNTLHGTATLYEAVGAYNGQVHKEIVTIVDKRAYSQLLHFIRETDRDAFITTYTVNEMVKGG